MKFSAPLEEAILKKRYKRFLADVELPDGRQLTLHCPNTGSMRNCAEPGSRIWYSVSSNPIRKYPGTWEIVEVDRRFKVGINTGRANGLVREAIAMGIIESLCAYGRVESEVRYGAERSRIDFLLSHSQVHASQLCYVEVKSVTLGLGGGVGAFPDAVTVRGAKHLRELITVRQSGHRAVLLYCVQHEGVERVVPADAIDPVYCRQLRRARDEGVEILAYGADLSSAGITLQRQLPVELD